MNLLTTMCEEGTGSRSEESSSLEEPDSSSALAVSDVLLDYKEFVKSGKKLEVKGFISSAGDITMLMEDRFNPSTHLLLNVDGLQRDVRKKIIKDGVDGFSVIVIGKAEDFVFQKGMILTKIKY